MSKNTAVLITIEGRSYLAQGTIDDMVHVLRLFNDAHEVRSRWLSHATRTADVISSEPVSAGMTCLPMSKLVNEEQWAKMVEEDEKAAASAAAGKEAAR
jgi:hypothetical protein